MTRSKRLRCHEIDAKNVISNLCVNISLRFLNRDEFYAIVIEEVHVILDLSCEMIIDVELIKSKDMIIIWDDQQNYMIMSERHFSMIVTIATSSRVKHEFISISILIIKSSVIFLIKRRHSRLKNVIVYAISTTTLKIDQEQNITIKHRDLLKSSYLFESISRTNLTSEKLIIALSAIVHSNQRAILVSNFELMNIKIIKKQLLDHLNSLASNAKKIFVEKICFVDVFTSKAHVELDMSYLIQYSKENISKTNIFNHWEDIYRTRVQEILNRHKKLFRNELKKFNDDIEMSISFIDETNVIDLKQTFYSLIAKNRRAMNEILDSFLNQSRLQKISLNKIFVATLSIFVIWKNDKFKVIVDLRKINTKLYSNAYSLFR